MDLYSIRNQRISPNEEFPLLCYRSARAWHSLLAERHTEKRKVLEEKKSIPFCNQEPILDPSRVLHSLAWCKRYEVSRLIRRGRNKQGPSKKTPAKAALCSFRCFFASFLVENESEFRSCLLT